MDKKTSTFFKNGQRLANAANETMRIDPFQIEATTGRFREREKQRARNERLINEGRPLAVDSPERVEKFLARRGFSRNEASKLLRSTKKGLPTTRELVGGQRAALAAE